MSSCKPFLRSQAARGAACLMLTLLWSGGAWAQSFESQQLPAVKGAPQGKPQQKSAGSGGGGGGGGEAAGLRERVEQLEGQLVDLQVVIGTLESLARTGGSVSAPVRSEAGGGLTGDDRARLDSLETQIRALTAQVEQLAAEMRAGGQRRSDAGSGFGDDAPQVGRFGSTTVTSDTGGPAEGFDGGGLGAAGPKIGAAPPAGGYGGPMPSPTYGSESLPPPAGGDQIAAVEPGVTQNPKQLYEMAYGHLLQQDYGAAQAGFRDFLKTYPQDALAPNALYWLGEAHYVQRNYADAAEAFDLVVSTYGNSSKAPDAQLKRGMSLAQLGKRQDACNVLREVSSRFPGAPVQVKAKADSERRRIACP